jgi:hypothetical protein
MAVAAVALCNRPDEQAVPVAVPVKIQLLPQRLRLRASLEPREEAQMVEQVRVAVAVLVLWEFGVTSCLSSLINAPWAVTVVPAQQATSQAPRLDTPVAAVAAQITMQIPLQIADLVAEPTATFTELAMDRIRIQAQAHLRNQTPEAAAVAVTGKVAAVTAVQESLSFASQLWHQPLQRQQPQLQPQFVLQQQQLLLHSTLW